MRSGYIMAQTGEFYITVQGKSAHAAEPHQGIDSILAAAQLVTAVDEIKRVKKEKTFLPLSASEHFTWR